MSLQFEREALMKEPLEDAEVHALLERLGEAQFAGDERATVGAVIEATGADPVLVARYLAEIRGKAFEERYRGAFEDHETRIDSLEERAARLERARPPVLHKPPAPRPYTREQLEIRDRAVRGEMEDDQLKIVWMVVAILAFIVFLWMSGGGG